MKEGSFLQAFKNEVSIMKKLDHHHVVTFIASYTEEKCFNILMTPVAEFNLERLLELPSSMENGSEHRSTLRHSFGCMARALRYLQQQKIRHKDIKPKNILVYKGSIFLADFGISKDYSGLSKSTTENFKTGTPMYWAPEVALGKKKSTSSDVWSLGCVYLRVWTVLQQVPVEDLDKFVDEDRKQKMYDFQRIGGEKPCDYMDVNAVICWLSLLEEKKQRKSKSKRATYRPPHWIREMVKQNRRDRIGLQELVRATQRQSGQYVGECCIAKRGRSTGKELILWDTMVPYPLNRTTRRIQTRKQ